MFDEKAVLVAECTLCVVVVVGGEMDGPFPTLPFVRALVR